MTRRLVLTMTAVALVLAAPARADKTYTDPAGDNGTYFQVLPYHLRKFTDHSRVTVDGNPLTWNTDVVAVPGQRAPGPVANVEVIFGGTAGDTTKQITAAQANGKFVVLLPAAPSAAPGGGRGQGGGRGGFGAAAPNRFAGAVAVATIDLDALTPAQRVAINALPDANAIAEELSALIENPAEIEAIGKRAREFVESRHHYITIAKKYLEIWNR